MALKVKNRINEQIRARELRVISNEGEQLGILSLSEAKRLAEEQGLDLVEIASNANPPVAKIMDFGKYRYTKEKQDKENRKNQKIIVVKEVKLKPQISGNDFEVKMKRVESFLSEGKKVKVPLVLRGRHRLHSEENLEILKKVEERFEERATIERNGSIMFLTPKK